MNIDKYKIYKLKLFNEDKYLYVASIWIKEEIIRVQCLKQPLHILSTSRSANSIFDGYDSEYDEKIVLLNFNNINNTFEVHKEMLMEVDNGELLSLLKHLTYINFLNKNSEYYDLNLKIFNEALDKFY